MALFAGSAAAQDYVPAEENIAAREQFSRDRFGIFIHRGIYSMLGNGEWVLQNDKLTQDEYSRLAAGFYPSRFDAEEWVLEQAISRLLPVTTMASRCSAARLRITT